MWLIKMSRFEVNCWHQKGRCVHFCVCVWTGWDVGWQFIETIFYGIYWNFLEQFKF